MSFFFNFYLEKCNIRRRIFSIVQFVNSMTQGAFQYPIDLASIRVGDIKSADVGVNSLFFKLVFLEWIALRLEMRMQRKSIAIDEWKLSTTSDLNISLFHIFKFIKQEFRFQADLVNISLGYNLTIDFWMVEKLEWKNMCFRVSSDKTTTKRLFSCRLQKCLIHSWGIFVWVCLCRGP